MSAHRVHHMKKQKQLSAPSVQIKLEKLEKKELQKYTREETKNKVLEMFRVKGDLNEVLYELGDLLPKFLHGTEKEREKMKEAINEKAMSVMYSLETDTHFALMESFDERFRSGAKEICIQFIRDLDCKTDVEKIMAETAAIGFIRFLDASRRLNNSLSTDNYLSAVKTGYMAMLSKERDRSHRQYLSTVATIKQLKAPAIEMNIKAKTAFIAQNQQINAPKQDNEINEPK